MATSVAAIRRLPRRKPMTTKRVSTPVFLSPDASTEEVARTAERLGVSVEDLERMMTFVSKAREHADSMDMPPPHLVSAAVTMISGVIHNYYEPSVHATLISDVVEQLYSVSGIRESGHGSETTH